MSCSARAVAVDLGGTKLSAAIVDETGRVSGRLDMRTDPRGGERVVQQVIEIAKVASQGVNAVGIGAAVPAAVDRQRRVVRWAPNIPGWRNVPLAARIEDATGLPASLEYDGHASILGEQWLGAARGIQNVVMLVIGTGIGGGVVCDGRLYRGSDGLAGAVGWSTCAARRAMPLAGPGVPALEMAAAGPGIAKRGRRRAASDVFVAATAGSVPARRVLEATADLIGWAVADLVSVLNPELVVFGGAVGVQLARGFLPRIRSCVRERAQPVSAKRVRLTTSLLGTDAGLFGAARGVLAQPAGKEEVAT